MKTSYMISDCGSVSSVDWSQSSQISGIELSDERRRFWGTVGGILSVTAGVVTVTALLAAVLPKKSRTLTWKVCVDSGTSRRTVNER